MQLTTLIIASLAAVTFAESPAITQAAVRPALVMRVPMNSTTPTTITKTNPGGTQSSVVITTSPGSATPTSTGNAAATKKIAGGAALGGLALVLGFL